MLQWNYAHVPRCWQILDSDWQANARAVFHRDEGEFSFTKVKFEVMHSCPSGDVCQTFQDVRRNVGVGRG